MSAPTVARILVYPIKSLDPASVRTAQTLRSGSFRHDREFALFDDLGRVINGKRNARIHRIRAKYDLSGFHVTLGTVETPGTQALHLVEQKGRIEEWLADFLGLRVRIRRNTETGFPDDLESPGPTIVSSGSLTEVGSWFGWDPLETARRFRANIEITTPEPFWEDRLFGASDSTVEFRIGDVRILGVNPCQRCAVPSRHPATGEVHESFQQTFSIRREQTIPSWATRSRFNHYYRLAVNTRIPSAEAGKSISKGDALSL